MDAIKFALSLYAETVSPSREAASPLTQLAFAHGAQLARECDSDEALSSTQKKALLDRIDASEPPKTPAKEHSRASGQAPGPEAAGNSECAC
eukprot:402556-Alexandrium_andersonii.AAC.1